MISDLQLGSAIRRLRRDAGMSIAALARHVGLHKSSLQAREVGETPTSAPELFALCSALGVSAADVLEECLRKTKPAPVAGKVAARTSAGRFVNLHDELARERAARERAEADLERERETRAAAERERELLRAHNDAELPW